MLLRYFRKNLLIGLHFHEALRLILRVISDSARWAAEIATADNVDHIEIFTGLPLLQQCAQVLLPEACSNVCILLLDRLVRSC